MPTTAYILGRAVLVCRSQVGLQGDPGAVQPLTTTSSISPYPMFQEHSKHSESIDLECFLSPDRVKEEFWGRISKSICFPAVGGCGTCLLGGWFSDSEHRKIIWENSSDSTGGDGEDGGDNYRH